MITKMFKNMFEFGKKKKPTNFKQAIEYIIKNKTTSSRLELDSKNKLKISILEGEFEIPLTFISEKVYNLQEIKKIFQIIKNNNGFIFIEEKLSEKISNLK